MSPDLPALPPDPPEAAPARTTINEDGSRTVALTGSTVGFVSDDELRAARNYVQASRARSTLVSYAGDWRRFLAWCESRNTPALPAAPALVAVYISALATAELAPSSIGRALASIAYMHRQAGLVAPQAAEGGTTLLDALAGIRRSRTTTPARKNAADADIVMKLLWAIEGESLIAIRDRALITLGMALAARRSELVALDVADLEWEEKGLRVTIRRSKTDKEAKGAVVAVPEGRRLTPLAHLRVWLASAKITDGAVFRPIWKGGRVRDARMSDHAVARIIQARAKAVGLDPSRFGGHSLRAGFVTAAARAGADVWKIQQVSRHKSMQVLSGYVRDARLFDDHAGEPFL